MRVGDPADEDSSDAHLLRLGSLLSIVSGQRTLCEVSWIEISNSLAMSPTTASGLPDIFTPEPTSHAHGTTLWTPAPSLPDHAHPMGGNPFSATCHSRHPHDVSARQYVKPNPHLNNAPRSAGDTITWHRAAKNTSAPNCTRRSGVSPTTSVAPSTAGTSSPTSWACCSTGSSPKTSPPTSTTANTTPATQTSTTHNSPTPRLSSGARRQSRKRLLHPAV